MNQKFQKNSNSKSEQQSETDRDREKRWERNPDRTEERKHSVRREKASQKWQTKLREKPLHRRIVLPRKDPFPFLPWWIRAKLKRISSITTVYTMIWTHLRTRSLNLSHPFRIRITVSRRSPCRKSCSSGRRLRRLQATRHLKIRRLTPLGWVNSLRTLHRLLKIFTNHLSISRRSLIYRLSFTRLIQNRTRWWSVAFSRTASRRRVKYASPRRAPFSSRGGRCGRTGTRTPRILRRGRESRTNSRRRSTKMVTNFSVSRTILSNSFHILVNGRTLLRVFMEIRIWNI